MTDDGVNLILPKCQHILVSQALDREDVIRAFPSVTGPGLVEVLLWNFHFT